MEKKILFGILVAIEAILIFSLGFISFMLIENSSIKLSLSIKSYEEASPSNYIEEKNIQVYKDRVIIFIDNSTLSNYADTNSMIPTLDAGANGIRIAPRDEKDIMLGDIISFEFEDKIIVHRVISIGKDQEGTYYITKGDNNPSADKKIRFKDIKAKTVAIIY